MGMLEGAHGFCTEEVSIRSLCAGRAAVRRTAIRIHRARRCLNAR